MIKRNFLFFSVPIFVQVLYICTTECFQFPNGLLNFYFVFDGRNAIYITIYAFMLVLYATDFDYTIINNHFDDFARIRLNNAFLWKQILRVILKSLLFALTMMLSEMVLLHVFKQPLFPLNAPIEHDHLQILPFTNDPISNQVVYSGLRILGSIIISLFFFSLSRFIKHRYLYVGLIPTLIIGLICFLGVLGPVCLRTFGYEGILPKILSTTMIGNVFSAGMFQMRTPRIFAGLASSIFYLALTVINLYVSNHLRKKGVV
ncbi:hypothetical protein PT105_04240 [Erysipelothrix rhusiopathiae]|nr:hypothetical protein [Erysipelothrix rhusiopathiae]MDE8329064.1 hypothetical protein [Erysipelothrix rhusiopathiae]MDE8332263.1 hypothetical protein [Erysipelothrix rhusiopathiae]MDE8337940.1 hypothetical protein [Erysipelothrix rhusiopathiae]